MPRGEAAKKWNSVENLLGRLLNKHYRLCRHHLLYYFYAFFSTLFTTFQNIRFLVPPSTMGKWHERWRKREDDTPLWKWERHKKKEKKEWKVWENHSHCLVSFFLIIRSKFSSLLLRLLDNLWNIIRVCEFLMSFLLPSFLSHWLLFARDFFSNTVKLNVDIVKLWNYTHCVIILHHRKLFMWSI